MKVGINVRLKKLRKTLNLTQTELGKKIGKKLGAVQQYEAGTRGIDMATVMLLQFQFGVNPDWLATGEGGMFISTSKNEEVLIPLYDIKASAGYGAWASGEAVVGYYPVPQALMKKELGANPKNINLLHVKGDSMTPLLQDGDLLAIDRSKTEARKGLYVCRVENDLYVKNVVFHQDVAVLTSENTAYDPIIADYNDFGLIGKVVWFGRTLK